MENYSGLWATSEGKQGTLDNSNRCSLALKLTFLCLNEIELNGNAEWSITDNITDETVMTGKFQA